MKNYLAPFIAIIFLMIAPYFSKQQPVEVTEFYWLTVYTFEMPRGFLDEGTHTFQFEFNYSDPEPGSLSGQVRRVKVSSQAPLFENHVLLRPNGIQGLGMAGEEQDCTLLKQINPGQPVRFMVGWVPDSKLTKEEMDAQIRSMHATVRWDDHPPVPMTAQLTTVSWEPLWNCIPWVDPESSDLLAGLPLN